MSDSVGPTSQQVPVGEPWLKAGRPDWSVIHFEVFCSRCGYELRMLEEARCPECGLQFLWPDVLRRTANRSPWLFEHQWRKRPLGSWFQTVRRSLRPRAFWSDVSIHDAIEPRPLWFLLLTAPVLAYCLLVAALLCVYAVAVGLESLAPLPVSPNPYVRTSMSIWMLLRSVLGQRHGGGLLPLVLWSPVGVLLGILGLISSLRQTLGRCRVRPVQTLRVVAYAATPICLLWIALFIVFILPGVLGLHIAGVRNRVLDPLVSLCFLTLLGAVPMVYVGVGLRHYLGLTHARAVAVVSVLVAFLFAFTVVVTIQYWRL